MNWWRVMARHYARRLPCLLRGGHDWRNERTGDGWMSHHCLRCQTYELQFTRPLVIQPGETVKLPLMWCDG